MIMIMINTQNLEQRKYFCATITLRRIGQG